MHLSNHASIRCQQRAISPMLLDLLLQFGSSERAGTGVSRVFFDKSSRRKIKAYAGSLAGFLDEHLDVYAVVTNDQKVITTGHRIKKFQTH